MSLDLTRTAAALVVFDAGRAARDAKFFAAMINEAVVAAVAADNDAADLVRDAFATDTAAVNSRNRAFLVHPDDPWLRRWVQQVTR